MRALTIAILVFFTLVPNVHATTVGDSCGDTQPCSSGQTCSDSPVGVCVSAGGGTYTTGVDTSTTRRTGVDTSFGSNVTLINPLGSGTSVMSFLTSILNIVTNTIGPVIVILMLVYVGFLFVTAQGEPGKLTTARSALLWTVVGALILLGAKVIALGIEATVRALSTGG